MSLLSDRWIARQMVLCAETVGEVREQVTEWTCSYKALFTERRWEKQVEELQKLVTPEAIQKFDKSQRNTTKPLSQYMEGSVTVEPPSQTEYCTLRDYILTSICINNTCRAGPASHDSRWSEKGKGRRQPVGSHCFSSTRPWKPMDQHLGSPSLFRMGWNCRLSLKVLKIVCLLGLWVKVENTLLIVSAESGYHFIRRPLPGVSVDPPSSHFKTYQDPLFHQHEILWTFPICSNGCRPPWLDDSTQMFNVGNTFTYEPKKFQRYSCSKLKKRSFPIDF